MRVSVSVCACGVSAGVSATYVHVCVKVLCSCDSYNCISGYNISLWT